MEREHRSHDQTRRRVLLGLGALGAGALGATVVRLTGSDGAVPGETIASAAGVTSTRLEPSTAPPNVLAETTTTRRPEVASTTIPALSVVVACREAWGAMPVSGVMTEHVPVRLTLHHTAVTQATLAQGPARTRQHQRYHQSLGWPDLAYHFLVDRSGLAYEGREVRFRGDTATDYDPTGHFLVCMEGDFDVQEPTGAQVETTVALFAWASQRYDIAPSTLAGHGSYADTSCPGASLSSMVPDLAVAVAGTAAVEIEPVCGPDGARLVAELEAG